MAEQFSEVALQKNRTYFTKVGREHNKIAISLAFLPLPSIKCIFSLPKGEALLENFDRSAALREVHPHLAPSNETGEQGFLG